MVERQVNAVSLAVSDLIITGFKCPQIGHTPGGDHADIGSKSLDTEFEADLVISLAGRAVADRDSTFLSCDLNKLLDDGRPCHGGSEKILVLIYCAGLHAGHNEILGEVIVDVFDI